MIQKTGQERTEDYYKRIFEKSQVFMNILTILRVSDYKSRKYTHKVKSLALPVLYSKLFHQN